MDFFLSMNSSRFEPMQLWTMISQFNYILHEEMLPVFILNLLPGQFLWSCQPCVTKKATSHFPMTLCTPL